MARLGQLVGPNQCLCRRQREYVFAARCFPSVAVVPFPFRRRWE